MIRSLDKKALTRALLIGALALLGTFVWFSTGADAAGLAQASDAENAANLAAQPNAYIQGLINGLVFGSLLALASVGLSLIYGTTGLSNFAHGEQVTMGSAVAFIFTTGSVLNIDFAPMPLLPAAILAVAVGGATGWLQDRFVWSKLRDRGMGNVQQMIVSIGFSMAMLNLIQMLISPDRKRLSIAIDVRNDYGAFELSNQTLASVAIAVAALGGVSYFLLRTRLGRATRAVSDNPALASASGIGVPSIIRLVWVMATGLAALGGILLALYENAFSFDSGARLLLLMFAAVTLGGLGHAFGALAGSLVIGVVAEMSTLWISPDLKFVSPLAILILVLLVRPQGILGTAERVG